MSQPTKIGTATWAAGSSITGHLAAMPAGIIAGDMIIVIWMRSAVQNRGTLDGKWTDINPSPTGIASTMGVRIVYAVADGTETGNIALTTVSGGARGASVTYVYRNYSGVPEANATSNQTNSGTTLDPPAVTPTGGSQDFTAIELTWINPSQTLSSFSTGYANGVSITDGSAVQIDTATKLLTAASTENPGNITYGTATTGLTNTVSIRGAVDVAVTDAFDTPDALGDRSFEALDPFDTADASSDRTFTASDAFDTAESVGDKTFSAADAFDVVESTASITIPPVLVSDTITMAEQALIEVAWTSGRIHVGRWDSVEDPKYSVSNEIISYEQVSDSASRPNVVAVDGNLDSWTEYDRSDLLVRDKAIVQYLDLPELKSPGEVRQRALEELKAARRLNSPGGTCVWQPWFTVKDTIFWFDRQDNKYTAKIEGIRVEFDFGTAPFQRVAFDLGNLLLCAEEEVDETYIVRDTFERDPVDGQLGLADLGGTWVIY